LVCFVPLIDSLGYAVGEGEVLVHSEQTVSEMVEEVLKRQAKTLADRTGEPLESAMSATLKTNAARQLKELSESAYGERDAAE
jgi:hypothetical protein